ncbi:MAG: methylmalonyl-CoA mutase small subunit [Muribaculaceae bacterium]
MAENKEKLFDQFAPNTKQEWIDKVTADLKGADFNKKLVWRTNEGFNVQPMYRAEDIKDFKTTDSLPGEFPYVRGTRTDNTWYIREDVVVEDAKAANAEAIALLDKGITSLGFSLKIEATPEMFATLLHDIDITKVEINLMGCPNKAVATAKALAEYLKGYDALDAINGAIEFDPFKRQLKHDKPFGNDIKALAAELYEAAKDMPGLRLYSVDSNLLCDAGAFIYQELGYALSWGAEWMNILTDAGIPAQEAAKRIKFNMGISNNYFMELAKFRAARMLWAQIVKQYNPACECACKIAVHAITSQFNQTIFDAHVNLLRTQTEAMSAALAGVDSITVLPFDKQYKEPDEFSKHLARNQQLLLMEESHLNKVIDPAGGSYYVETLTVSIAEQAWKTFIAGEDKGGFEAILSNGEIQKEINATAQARHLNVARRKEQLLGTNQFPNFNEMAAGKIEKQEGKCCCGCEEGENALNRRRAASDFEELRLATENSGKRPKVFMLTIGNLAMRLARSQFSSNFFACAGYEIIDNLGFETVQQGVDAALAKGAEVIVLCSSDDEYETLAPEAFNYLNGRAQFVVAGNPACTEALQAAGIENFIHVRSNVLETLKAFNAKLLK